MFAASALCLRHMGVVASALCPCHMGKSQDRCDARRRTALALSIQTTRQGGCRQDLNMKNVLPSCQPLKV